MTIEEKISIIGACKTAARDIVTSLEASIGQGSALPAVVKAVALYDCLADMEQGLADYALAGGRD